MGVGPRASAGQGEADRSSGHHPRDALDIPRRPADVEVSLGADTVDPGVRPGRADRVRRLYEDKVGLAMQLRRRQRHDGGRAGRRRVRPGDQHQAIDLTNALVRPVLLLMVGGHQHHFVVPFNPREPFRSLVRAFRSDHGDGDPELRDRLRDLLGEAPRVDALRDADETKHGGPTDAAGAGRLSRALDHQPREFGHHIGAAPRLLEEVMTGQGQDIRIPQGGDRGRMRRAGDQRHLAGGLSGGDDTQQVRGLVRRLAVDAEAA